MPDLSIRAELGMPDRLTRFLVEGVVQAHAIHLPNLTNSGLTMSLGAMTDDYIVNREKAAYVPARSALRYLASGQLHLVADAPRFPYPAWAVWREDLDPVVRDLASRILREVAEKIDDAQVNVLEKLAEISEEHAINVYVLDTKPTKATRHVDVLTAVSNQLASM
jgi:hypothetical protein